MCSSDVFLCLLCILFPPIGVWIKRGLCSADSLINIALCCLGWFPGLLHAWYIILMYPDDNEYEQIPDSEHQGGSVTYYYVSRPPPSNGPMPSHPSRRYGTVPASAAPAGGQFPGQESGVVNSFARNSQGQRAAGASNGPQPQGGEATGPPPPSYADVIKGDHKVQSHE